MTVASALEWLKAACTNIYSNIALLKALERKKMIQDPESLPTFQNYIYKIDIDISIGTLINTSNAEATFIQSTRAQ